MVQTKRKKLCTNRIFLNNSKIYLLFILMWHQLHTLQKIIKYSQNTANMIFYTNKTKLPNTKLWHKLKKAILVNTII